TGDTTIPTNFTADGTEGQRIVVNIASRTHLRTGGPVTDTSAATPMPGETQPGVITNVATGSASNPVTTVEVPEDGDDYTCTPGTTAFTVSKTPDASQLVPGQEQPFKLTVVNTGTSPLWNPVFTDVLPA